MAVTKQKKEEVLRKLKDGLKKSKFIVFVNFHGLNVASAGELRKMLRKMEAGYSVVKKTLIKKALEEIKFSGDIPELEGEIGVAFSENDSVETIKSLRDFAKKKNIKLIGGVFENKYIDDKTVIMLANIPPREILLAQLVNVINSPIQGVVVSLNEIMGNFVRVLNQIKNVKT